MIQHDWYGYSTDACVLFQPSTIVVASHYVDVEPLFIVDVSECCNIYCERKIGRSGNEFHPQALQLFPFLTIYFLICFVIQSGVLFRFFLLLSITFLMYCSAMIWRTIFFLHTENFMYIHSFRVKAKWKFKFIRIINFISSEVKCGEK